MKRIALLVAVASLGLSSCGITSALTGIPSSPAAVADRTKLDEQTGIALTLAYTAASRAAGLAITGAAAIGHPFSSATLKRIGELDSKAFAAVTAVRQAYLAANSTGYLAAIEQAKAAIAELLAAFGGGAPTALQSVPFGDAYATAMGAHAGLALSTGA